MGYKKLDEVMELLTDELDGFERAVDRLERLTENTDNIKVWPNTSEIEAMLHRYLDSEETRALRIEGSVNNIEKTMSESSLIPRVRLWLLYAVWMASLIIIGYLSFRVSRVEDVRKSSFEEGRQEVLSSLRAYFDRYPEKYESYREWKREMDSVQSKK